ncbi:hypothetical protein Syun_019501 [Stephania yunnanensis]|uniref:Uncharacterized protein n=1 Tax=Stephania yunnanensis TaxID=152371 RepID=A0AAP0NXI0_9MAGN
MKNLGIPLEVDHHRCPSPIGKTYALSFSPQGALNLPQGNDFARLRVRKSLGSSTGKVDFHGDGALALGIGSESVVGPGWELGRIRILQEVPS